MSIFDAPRPDAGADDGLDDGPDRQTWRSRGQPGLEENPSQWLILKRGQERLALFLGWPEPGLAQTFRERAMTIGLALEGPDLAEPGRFDDCGYVYIGLQHRLGSTLADALRDLSRANWTVDQEAAWPVITGGYQPRMPDAQPSENIEEQAADPQDLPILRPSERMEA